MNISVKVGNHPIKKHCHEMKQNSWGLLYKDISDVTPWGFVYRTINNCFVYFRNENYVGYDSCSSGYYYTEVPTGCELTIKF